MGFTRRGRLTSSPRPGLLLALVVLPPAAPPDILPIGNRAIRHELVFEDAPVFKQYRFIAGPVRGFHGVTVISPGVPFRFSSKYGTKVYALPLDVPVPDETPRWKSEPEGWPESARPGRIPVVETRSVPLGSPVHRVLTTLRIREVTSDAIELEVASEERWDRHGRPFSWLLFPLLLAIAAVGAVGLWSLERSRPPVEKP